jgi:glycosyltransferase involved in cell wall biosynthesis
MNMGISIIICCYNSEKRLETTLRALSRVAIPAEAKAELILVDNNSADGTLAFAARYWGEAGNKFPLQAISEPKQGQMHARLRGITAARYDIILFVDDDNELQPDYLEHGYRILSQHPDVGILGGISHGVFKSQLPAWINPGFPFKSLLNSLAVSTVNNSATGYLYGSHSFIFGAASFYRKSIFDSLREHQHELKLTGRKGNVLMSCDDIELCMLAKMMGFKLYRSAQLNFNHHIDCSRLDKSYFERLFFGFGYCSLILQSYTKCLGEDKSMPNLASVCQKAEDKIKLLRILSLLFLPFRDKAFKINLLIRFEEGLIKFVEENEDYAEAHASIIGISEKLAAQPEPCVALHLVA